jgi:small subunit ribosomal protein S17
MDSAAENKATDSHCNTRNDPRRVTGVVSSDKMNKTRSVTVVRLVPHPLYKKYMRRRTTYKAHDENNTSRSGDKVVIAQTRPLSKTKSWRLVEVLERAKTRGSPSDGSGAE